MLLKILDVHHFSFLLGNYVWFGRACGCGQNKSDLYGGQVTQEKTKRTQLKVDSQKTSGSESERQRWRCDRSVSPGPTQVDTHTHTLALAAPVSCASIMCQCTSKFSQKGQKNSPPAPFCTFPVRAPLFPVSPPIPPTATLSVGTSPIFLPDPSTPHFLSTLIFLLIYPPPSPLFPHVSLSHSLLSYFLPSLSFSTIGLDRAIITLPPIYSQPVIFHLL